MRSGVTFDADGMPIGFTDKVYEDMQALIDVSHALGVRLMPVLLDYTMADGVDYELCEVGEHPDILTDSDNDYEKRAAFVAPRRFRRLFQRQRDDIRVGRDERTGRDILQRPGQPGPDTGLHAGAR